MNRTQLLASAACGLAMLGTAAPAAAQARLEEIVVTARRTEERLQTVPLSITAFTAKDIAERGLNDVYDVSQFTPGFSFEKLGNRYGSQNGGNRPVIRGMSNIGSEANAGTFIDGIPFTNNILSFPFDIVERVEILKGPQATQFGRATFAGAINLITKRPTNEFEHRASIRIAQYNDYEVNLLSRGPIVEDKVFYMVHGRWYDFGGQYTNALDGGKVGQEHTLGGNASLEFRPSDSFRATFSGGYSYDDDGLAPSVLQDRLSNNCFLDRSRQYYCGVVKRQDQTRINRARLLGQEGLRRHSTRLMATLEYDADAFIVTSNTGVFLTDDKYGYDSDYIDANRSTTNLRLETSDRDEWSTELRVRTADENRFRFMGGVFYYKRDRETQERHFSTAPTIDFGESFVENKAAFGSIDADITDAFNARVELRYAEDKISLRAANGQFTENTFKSWLPRVTAKYTFDTDTQVYATVAKGNKPGALNADPRLPPALVAADEEQSWNYEIGTKNTLLDGALVLNAALYYIDWDKQQLTDTFFLPGGGTLTYLVNVGKTEVKGLEFSMEGAFNDYLTGGFSYGLNDAKFVEFNDAEARELFGNPSVKGKQTPNSPKHQFSIYGRVRYPVTDEIDGFFRADFAYTDSKFDQIYNLASTGDQKLLNLKAGVESENWTFTLFVDNVTDDRTPSSVIRYVDNKNPLPIAGTMRVNTIVRGFLYSLPDKRRFGMTASVKF